MSTKVEKKLWNNKVFNKILKRKEKICTAEFELIRKSTEMIPGWELL